MVSEKLYGLTVAVSLTASVIQAFAITLQRRSHILNDAASPDTQRSSFRRPMWVTGFLMYTIANIIGSIFTIGYLPIVVLAPVGAMNLVFNAIFAKIMLGDPFTKRTAYGELIFKALIWTLKEWRKRRLILFLVFANFVRYTLDCHRCCAHRRFWGSS